MHLWRNLLQLLLELLVVLLHLIGCRATMWAAGIHANRVNGAVNTNATGQVADSQDRVFFVEIDNLSALATRRP